MILKIETYQGLPCKTSCFTINGRDADIDYFGKATVMNDPDSDDELDRWGCRDRIWSRYINPDLIKRVCFLYNIDEDEYNEICDILEEKLSLGDCGWCV